MLSPEEWKYHILDCVAYLASRDRQLATWVGAGPLESSPEEDYCWLFDDFNFDDFLDGNEVVLSNEQQIYGQRLRELMNSYLTDMPSDPLQVLDDPCWEQIRQAAQKFLDSFSAS